MFGELKQKLDENVAAVIGIDTLIGSILLNFFLLID